MRFHMNGSSDDNEILTAAASAEHMRKFVFSSGSEAPIERLEIKIPEVNNSLNTITN